VFIDEHRDRFGVEPICRTLGVSASACYYRAMAAPSARAVSDERLIELIGVTSRTRPTTRPTGIAGPGRRCAGLGRRCRGVRSSV
jgi:hypothetical protein